MLFNFKADDINLYEENSNAAYFVQIRTFERRLLKLAFEQSNGDMELASSVIGISRSLFFTRASLLGGVFPDSAPTEPMNFNEEDLKHSTRPAPKLVDRVSFADDELPPPPADNPWFSGTASVEKAPALSEGDNPVPLAVAVPVASHVVKQEEPVSSAPVSTASTPVSTNQEDAENKQGKGRPVGASPNPNFLTSREAETALGISAAGLGYLKNKGQLSPIFDEDVKLWLYPKHQIDSLVQERAAKRSAK